MAIQDVDGTIREIGLEEATSLLLTHSYGLMTRAPHEMTAIPSALLEEAKAIVHVNALTIIDGWKRQNK